MRSESTSLGPIPDCEASESGAAYLSKNKLKRVDDMRRNIHSISLRK